MQKADKMFHVLLSSIRKSVIPDQLGNLHLIARRAKTVKFAFSKNSTKANFAHVKVEQRPPKANTSGARLKRMLQAREKIFIQTAKIKFLSRNVSETFKY